MKKLEVKTPLFTELEHAYRNWLQRLGYSKYTVYNLPNHIREFFHWLENNNIYTTEQINAEVTERFMDYFAKRPNQKRGGGLGIAHINRQAEAIKKLAVFLTKTGMVSFKHCLTYRKNEPKTGRIILGFSEIGRLYDACGGDVMGDRDRVMLGIYYGCGLRRSEGVNLLVGDIFFERKLLFVSKSKTGTQRLVPVTIRVLQDLEKYIFSTRNLLSGPGENGHLFLGIQGRKLSGQALSVRLKILAERAGLSKSFGLHTLRHSIATHLLQQGMELERIGDFLGHKTLDSTQIYTHII